MKLAIPDLISNSYFPALAAAELGFFEREGIEVSAELIFPVDRTYAALRDGAVDFVGGAAHGALAAFTEWRGVKLLGALSQGMYWFLVMRAELGIARGDLAALKGRRIGAAPSGSARCPAPPAQVLIWRASISGSPRRRRWRTARSTGSGPTAWGPRS